MAEFQRPLRTVYDAAYRGGPPNWDVGRPQRPFVLLAEAGGIGRRVLDVGCGTGELSLFLARHGHEVLGIDFAPSAVEQARAKARWRRIPAQFLVWDALRIDELGLTFDTVVDSAMFHVLGDGARERFVEQLEAVLPPGGSYVVLGDHRPDDRPVWEGGISRSELRHRFADGWRLDWVYDTAFERRGGWNPALFARATRTGD